MFVGIPYYDPHYSYYYDGHDTFRQKKYVSDTDFENEDDLIEARRSSGSSRGGSRSSSYGMRRRYSGGYSSAARGYKTRSYAVRTITRSNGSSFKGKPVSSGYRPYGGYMLIVGNPYYDPHYGYYYDGD